MPFVQGMIKKDPGNVGVGVVDLMWLEGYRYKRVKLVEKDTRTFRTDNGIDGTHGQNQQVGLTRDTMMHFRAPSRSVLIR